MFEALTSAFGLIFLAELGDKSMLFSLTAATRYRWWAVLIPVTIATALLTGLAVVAGGVVAELLPERAVAVVAGVLFLVFGMWTLRADEDEEEDDLATARRGALRIMMALGAVFFLAEFGDKTQIATVALSGLHPGEGLAVWAGATGGMVATNALAIAAGARLERYLPPRVIRIVAATVFFVFGVLALLVAVR